MENERLLRSRLTELAERAYTRDILTHSPFLTLDEQSLLLGLAGRKGNVLSGASFFLFGEEEGYERKCAVFSSEPLGQEERSAYLEEIVACLKIAPRSPRFAEELGHRDFLGAIMSLGLERREFGDLFLQGGTAYLLAFRQIAPRVIEELKEVRHTAVKVEEVSLADAPFEIGYEEKVISVSQSRLDAVLKEAAGLSREGARKKIEEGLVYVDGRLIEEPSRLFTPGERVSIRGWGKFVYGEEEGRSRKGRLLIKIKVYK